MQNTDALKEQAARKSLEFIEDGMVVGLGSGSTAEAFIRLLGARFQQGLKVRGIATSLASEELAKSFSIPIIDFGECSEIDVAVDGADEISPLLGLIKGGGGALLREKIVASAAKKLIVVADSSKLVQRLGNFPLPVEVIPMAAPLVARKLHKLGIESKVRVLASGEAFMTDEENLIVDCACGEMEDPAAVAASIRAVVGVVDHGLFLDMAEMAIIADANEVRLMRRRDS